MAAFVLVPGAWIGGWAWQVVAQHLRQAGHDVYPVTLTGLGERVHLARAEVDLETHILDVLNLMQYEELRDVVLVGHSYGGVVVTGVADRAPERLSHLVYVDTGPLADGESMLTFEGEGADRLRQIVREKGDGWRLPFPGFEGLGPPPMVEGLGHDERTLLERKATAQPFRTYDQPLRLKGRDGRYKKVLISCNGFRFVEKVAPQLASFLTPKWRRIELETGHWPMLSEPEPLSTKLLEAHR